MTSFQPICAIRGALMRMLSFSWQMRACWPIIMTIITITITTSITDLTLCWITANRKDLISSCRKSRGTQLDSTRIKHVLSPHPKNKETSIRAEASKIRQVHWGRNLRPQRVTNITNRIPLTRELLLPYSSNLQRDFPALTI